MNRLQGARRLTSRRVKHLAVAVGLLLLTSAVRADDCASRASAAVAELTVAATGAGRDELLAAFERVCRDAMEEGARQAAVQTSAPTEILGVEIRDAPKEAAGHSRARKTP